MQLDAFTVVSFSLFIKVTLGALMFIFWLRDGRAIWFAWGGAVFAFAAPAGVLFVLRGVVNDFFSMAVGTAMLIAAFAAFWQAARTFEGRRVLWGAFVALPLLWLVICLSPAVMGSVAARVMLSSAMIGPSIAATAFEFWRGRGDGLPSRGPLITLLVSLALLFFIRIPMVGALPFPFGALPMQMNWVVAFNLVLAFHAVILTVLFISLSKERRELDERTKAQTDPLTGALNRRALMVRGRRVLLRLERESKPACLVFLDLDNFKSLNDRFTHSGGDEVLIRFVSLVHDSIRPSDFMFRVGGEEFCCLLPDTNVVQAHHVAERIREKFEAARLIISGVPVRTTVSLGIASTESFGYDIELLMRQADKAVYAAKHNGRNRVALATAGGTAAPLSVVAAREPEFTA